MFGNSVSERMSLSERLWNSVSLLVEVYFDGLATPAYEKWRQGLAEEIPSREVRVLWGGSLDATNRQ